MGPKVSRKTAEKEKQKIIEDKTFGLKNKNRSAKVQAYVAQVQQTVKCGSREAMKAQAEREAKKKSKEDKKAFEAAMAKLFNGEGKGKGGSDSDDDDDEEGEEGEEGDKQLGVDPNDYLWRPEDFDEVEADDGRLEEMLEAERAALQGRTDLTPVNAETFAAWRERKKAEKLAAEKRRVELAKKGQGKLRGWDLWNEKRDLFVDDEDGETEYVKEFEDATLFEDATGDAAGDDEQMDFGEGDGAAAAAAAAASGAEADESAAAAAAAATETPADAATAAASAKPAAKPASKPAAKRAAAAGGDDDDG
jgi:hypothetical protein